VGLIFFEFYVGDEILRADFSTQSHGASKVIGFDQPVLTS
jgi:hypothetical protein